MIGSLAVVGSDDPRPARGLTTPTIPVPGGWGSLARLACVATLLV